MANLTNDNSSKPKIDRGKVRDFDKRISKLVSYFQAQKDKTVGIGDIKQKDECGSLIRELKREYKLGKLLPEEIELLEYMGLSFKSSFYETVELLKLWCTKNKKSLKYANQYSKLEIEIDGEVVVIDIGNIIKKLRFAKRNGELSSTQIKILDMMEIIWEPRKVEVLYAHLIAYGEECGTLQDIEPNTTYLLDGKSRNIFRQAERLRLKYKNGTLNQEIKDYFDKYHLWDDLKQEESFNM
ncbi:MAG: hypothetical protein IJ358_00865 [Clostridia bacterium]|nr:hypothetical protein [Clostridia bacterium]